MGGDGRPDPTPPACRRALGAALDRVGDRWSLLLVEALLPGPLRFNEIAGGACPGSPRTSCPTGCGASSARGILVAHALHGAPLRMEYALTVDGRELAGALRLLADWGGRARRGGAVREPLRHEPCGTPLEARWHCPTCERLVRDDEAAEDRLI